MILFCNPLDFTVKKFQLPPPPTPTPQIQKGDHTYWLQATAFSICLKPVSVSEGHPFYEQCEGEEKTYKAVRDLLYMVCQRLQLEIISLFNKAVRILKAGLSKKLTIFSLDRQVSRIYRSISFEMVLL